jgi:hypothetical protein
MKSPSLLWPKAIHCEEGQFFFGSPAESSFIVLP